MSRQEIRKQIAENGARLDALTKIYAPIEKAWVASGYKYAVMEERWAPISTAMNSKSIMLSLERRTLKMQLAALGPPTLLEQARLWLGVPDEIDTAAPKEQTRITQAPPSKPPKCSSSLAQTHSDLDSLSTPLLTR